MSYKQRPDPGADGQQTETLPRIGHEPQPAHPGVPPSAPGGYGASTRPRAGRHRRPDAPQDRPAPAPVVAPGPPAAPFPALPQAQPDAYQPQGWPDQQKRQPSFTPSPQYGQAAHGPYTPGPGSPQAIPPGQQYPGQQYPGQQYPGQQYSGQQYSGQQYSGLPRGGRPRRSWFARHKVLTGLLSVIALLVIGIVAAAANSPRITPKAASSTASTPPTAQDAQNTASPTSSSPPTGSIGTTFTVTSSDGSSYDVTLDQVNQDATLAPYETLENQADHAAAAEFTITGESGQSSDDANSDANAIGSDQTEYVFAALSLTVPNFNAGDFTVAPGQTEKGWVAFELPPGVTIAQVQWAPGIGGQAATWQVSS